MSNAGTAGYRPIRVGLGLGAAAGSIATALTVLTSPELYIDWGSLVGTLVVIPLVALLAGAAITVPLALLRRIAWTAVPVAAVTAVVIGQLIFQVTLRTPFARWSSARHWAEIERRAAAGREEAERDICRRLLAEPPIPPPPAPPGAEVVRGEAVGERPSLLGYSREHCEALLAR